MIPKGTDLSELMPLVIALALVFAVVVIVDIILLTRWLIYQVQLREAYQRLSATPSPTITVDFDVPFPVPGNDEGRPPAPNIGGDMRPPAHCAPQPPSLGENAPPTSPLHPPAPKFGGDSPPAPNLGGGEETDAAAESFLTPSGETQPPSDTTAVPAVASFPKPPFAPTWSLTHPFFGIQFVLIAVNVIAVALLPLFYVVANLRHLPQDQILQAAITNVTIVALLIQNVLFVVVVGYYLRRYGLTLADIGLGRPTSRQIALGIGIGASMFLVSALLEMALSHAISPTDIKHLQKITESVDAGAMFQKLPSVWSKLLFAFGGAVLAPIGEEVFFRGLLYNALKRRWNVPAGIVVSGLAFAVIHFNPLSLIVIFCMGMLLAYVYERTNSLWVTIMMHAMNNGAAFAITWFFPALGK